MGLVGAMGVWGGNSDCVALRGISWGALLVADPGCGMGVWGMWRVWCGTWE